VNKIIHLNKYLCQSCILLTLVINGFSSILCGGVDQDLEILKTIYEGYQAAKCNYGQGLGIAKVVIDSSNEEEQEDYVVDFKYKNSSSRYDMYSEDGKLLRKKAITPKVEIWCNETAAVIQKPVIAVEEMFGRYMDPSIFNSFYGSSLEGWLKGVLKAGKEGRALVDVEIDSDGRIHLTETMLRKNDKDSTVAKLLIDTEDGFRIISATCESRYESGEQDLRNYKVDWVKYKEQWYVKSARYDSDEKYLDDKGNLKSFTKSTSVEIKKYVVADNINDDEFSLARMANKGVYVRDKIAGVAYVFGNETVLEDSLNSLSNDMNSLKPKAERIQKSDLNDNFANGDETNQDKIIGSQNVFKNVLQQRGAYLIILCIIIFVAGIVFMILKRGKSS
jgi:hypothetical protein